MNSFMARLTSSSLCLSPATLNCPSSSLISLTSRQGRTSQSSLAVLAAVSPLVRAILPPSCCLLPSYHLLLPQFQEEDVDLLLQFLTGGMVASSLRDCSQVLEMLQVLGVDTRNVVLEKKMAEVVKQETTVGDTSSEGREDDEEDEVDIVYEGQSSNVARAERTSFVKVKTEADSIIEADEALALPDTSRARLPPLSSPTPPPSSSSSSLSSSSVQGYNFLDLVSAGMLARRKEKRVVEMVRQDMEETSKKMKM
jgi:hypothetical protein